MISRVSRQFDVQLGPDDVLGAAILCPGFCEDLTTWRLTIDAAGLITQQIFLGCYPLFLSETLTRTTQLTREQLEQLFQLADETDFAGLREEYDPQVDDAEVTTIVLRTASGTKRVCASDAFHAAEYEDDADMQRYVCLWNAIVGHAPSSSAAWRRDREAAERKMEIARLKLRVNENDFARPTLDNLVGALACPPAIGLLLQLFSWNLSGGVRDFPNVPQLILWSCITYTVMILVFIRQAFVRRRDRLAARRQLAQYESEDSEMNPLEPNTEN